MFVTLPPEYARPEENVVVATPTHPPLMNASTWPAEPEYKDVVETAVGTAAPPVKLARTVFAAIAERPMVAFDPPTSAPAPPERVMPLLDVSVVVATEVRPLVPFPYKSCDEVNDVCPVPPRETPSVPVVSESAIPKVEVANAVTFAVPPVAFPRMVFGAICASFVSATPFVAMVSVPFAPPTSEPSVPEYANSAPAVIDDVATDWYTPPEPP